jgi:hypothetical protein
MRQASLPAFVFVDIAGALILAGYGLVWSGTRQFAGRAVDMRMAMAAAVLWLLACRLGLYHPGSDRHTFVLLALRPHRRHSTRRGRSRLLCKSRWVCHRVMTQAK